MPIDFFTTPCTQENACCQLPHIVCKRTTKNEKFGLCDEQEPTPAYIQFHTPDDWIAEVSNPHSKEITFKAIDNCVPIKKADGTLESRCDGMLIHNNILTFVELKDKGTPGWLSEGREQLTTTIENFISNHNIELYNTYEAFVCNKQRPLVITGINTEVQKFKDKTANLLDNNGLFPRVTRKIEL